MRILDQQMTGLFALPLKECRGRASTVAQSGSSKQSKSKREKEEERDSSEPIIRPKEPMK
jgi:hypothetical protein